MKDYHLARIAFTHLQKELKPSRWLLLWARDARVECACLLSPAPYLWASQPRCRLSGCAGAAVGLRPAASAYSSHLQSLRARLARHQRVSAAKTKLWMILFNLLETQLTRVHRYVQISRLINVDLQADRCPKDRVPLMKRN